MPKRTKSRNVFDLEHRKRRIAAIASELVESMIKFGEVPLTTKAIQKAMAQAVKDATAAYDAAVEFIS